MRKRRRDEYAYILAGGGLQNSLIAWLLLKRDPEARVALVESGDKIGGNHTWSFHETDVPHKWTEAIQPLVQHAWAGYEVRFPRFTRHVALGYRSLHSTHLHKVLCEAFAGAPNARLFLSTTVAEIHADRLVTTEGIVLHGQTVIDARGPATTFEAPAAEGYQKFVGLELQLEGTAPSAVPTLMDACVPQDDGFRFFYVLPLEADRVLIEDTRFSDNPHLDVASLQDGVLQYAAERGYAVKEIIRREVGVLPMPYTSRSDWPRTMPLRAGYAAGFMHPATGYSFPVALRVACHVAACAPETPLGPAWDALLERHHQQYRFAAFLNRLLFTAYRSENRYHIFQRFYGHAAPVIARFYRLDMSGSDRARMFLGRPPRGFSLKRMVEGALYR